MVDDDRVSSADAVAVEEFDPRAIDARWQRVWDEEKSWEVRNDADLDRATYVLEMLPYTSGEPHVGHLKNYAVGDAIAHFMRRQGKYVLHPMGFDAFGLPAENHAIRTGKHPRESTRESIESFREQFKQWGISIDWTRELATNEPDYYRWTQWIFLKLYEAGLAYRTSAAVNWCPMDATVLANEQVVDGRCERCGTLVEARNLEQWFFKTSAYADRLIDDLDDLQWPPHVKTMQRNWIGRSAGANVRFAVTGSDIEFPVFTTRPDTLFGVTFLAVSPEHPDLERLIDGTDHAAPVREYVNSVRRAGRADRGGDRAKTGVPTGRTARHPLTGEMIPIFVVDYVLMEYGTGAIMGVPAHDDRDFAFAHELKLDVKAVVKAAEGESVLPFSGRGTVIASGRFDGLDSTEAAEQVVQALADQGDGGIVTSYRLRDWLLSRQRYWGCPIPILYCDGCGIVPVPEDSLPVVLPDVRDYAPKGKSPLAGAEDWVATSCPRCGGAARRETDTMDTFVDSSWYYLRYCDPTNDSAPWSADAVRTWMPIDQYIGGVEHAILHLLYSRFLCKALSDLGHLSVQEPFQRLFTQGMITRNGAKMSKSRGNVVSPRTFVERYGADTARAYVLFMGPPEAGADWSDEGVEGVYRFLRRVWRLSVDIAALRGDVLGETVDVDRERALNREVQATILKVTADLDVTFSFNTAIASLMKLSNTLSRSAQLGLRRDTAAAALSTLASLLLPFAPHVASDVYYRLTRRHVWDEPWPVADETVLRKEVIDLVLQINSKTKGKIAVSVDADEDEVRQRVREQDIVQTAATGRGIKRIVVVPGRLVNVVL